MSSVSQGSVSSSQPRIDANSPQLARGYPSGSSNGGFTYLGTSTAADGNVWVVLQASSPMSVTGQTSDKAGEIFDPSASGGVYCWLCIGKQSNQNWTVRARTSRDGATGGVTYSAGTGGGPGGA